MNASTSFDWQVFEEKDWEDAVASGVLAGGIAYKSTAPTGDSSRSANVPWFVVAGIALAVLFLYMAYAPWSAQRADAMPLADDNALSTTLVQVETKDGYLRVSQRDPAPRAAQRLRILSAYFQFEYNFGDQEAVTVAAAQLDPFYHALRQFVGLGPSAPRIHVEVLERAMTTGWQQSGGSVLTPSPAFLQTLPEATAATLIQNLRGALVHLVLTERLAEAPIDPKWGFLVEGLRHWLQTCYESLGERPCAGRQAAATMLNATPPLSLADLTFTDADWVATTWGVERVHGAKWLVAYIVDAYGVEKPPVFLEGMRQYDHWQTLIPAVFDLSLEQFERDWHQADGASSSG